jgi:hypothetical protein
LNEDFPAYHLCTAQTFHSNFTLRLKNKLVGFSHYGHFSVTILKQNILLPFSNYLFDPKIEFYYVRTFHRLNLLRLWTPTISILMFIKLKLDSSSPVFILWMIVIIIAMYVLIKKIIIQSIQTKTLGQETVLDGISIDMYYWWFMFVTSVCIVNAMKLNKVYDPPKLAVLAIAWVTFYASCMFRFEIS